MWIIYSILILAIIIGLHIQIHKNIIKRCRKEADASMKNWTKGC